MPSKSIGEGTPHQQQPASNQRVYQPSQQDLLSLIGNYGVGIALLLTLGKMYADYQLKVALEDRALKSKSENQSLEMEGKVFQSVISQHEAFIQQSIVTTETSQQQISKLIETIATLTEVVKLLEQTQKSQLVILESLKDCPAQSNDIKEIMATLKQNKTVNEKVILGLAKILQVVNQKAP